MNKTTLIESFKGVIFLALGVAGGTTWHQSKLNESNVEVMSVDSDVALTIAEETKEQKVKLDEKHEINTANGFVTYSGMQLIQSAITDAKQRTDKIGFIKTFTRR